MVAAYLRRDRNRSDNANNVLVVINLSATALSGVTISSPPGALPSGQYAVREAFDHRYATRFRVGASGRVRRYAPYRTLAPMQSYILELSAPGR
jgi:hypothetical protein